MIRHARPAPALAVLLLPVSVVEPAFGTLLIAAVGRPVLSAPSFSAARRAAIALSSIAMCTNLIPQPLPTAHNPMGQVAEVFDGDTPQRAGGCIAQAWSLAELLRACVEDGVLS